MSRIDTFLELAMKQGGSDLHLVSGHAPRIRINGVLHRVRFRDLSMEDMARMLEEIMSPLQWELLQGEQSLDFAHEVPELGRFRVNAYRHLHGWGAALRSIPLEVPHLEGLGLPRAIQTAVEQPKGLSLVTGPTGSGKSTTLAAIVQHINNTRRGHIITIEDPIEFIHRPASCAITQREIGRDSPSFADALRDAVREDPDVILVGELRDVETISLALTAAETGIQVLGTLHTNGAARTVDRMVNVFPAARQAQVRTMLSDSLRLVVSQRLLRNAEGDGRVPAVEILVNTHAASSLIRTGNSHKLESVIQAGRGVGMQKLDSSLKELVRRGLVTAQEAAENAVERAEFDRMAAREEAA